MVETLQLILTLKNSTLKLKEKLKKSTKISQKGNILSNLIRTQPSISTSFIIIQNKNSFPFRKYTLWYFTRQKAWVRSQYYFVHEVKEVDF